MGNKKTIQKIIFLAVLFFFCIGLGAQNTGIRPYFGNPFYWEYRGEPVLLIGGSSNDNLFQDADVVEELNLIQAFGGNYVRCTLSGRDAGNEWPFWRKARHFNLNKANPEYWKSLDSFFKLTAERNIFVQVEIWAFYDFMDDWERNPWNPAVNNVFSKEETLLKPVSYGDYWNARHDFFLSVPELNNDRVLLEYQEMFVDHLLSISLKYDHILYCITNEIFKQYPPEWGWYWAKYIKQRAREEGVEVHVTEMFQNPDVTHEQHKASYEHPEIYSFVELSQNSRVVGQTHWEQFQKAREAVSENPRPLNHVKIYGGPLGEWTDGPNHGIYRFWRNLLGGAASVRFHMPPQGIGITERARMHIKSARVLASEYNFFSSVPDVDFSLLGDRDEDEAYLASNSQNDLVVFFPDGGEVKVDLTRFKGRYRLKWLNLEGANWYRHAEIDGGKVFDLKSPYSGTWVALFSRIAD